MEAPKILVHSVPSEIPVGGLRGGVAIVVDVLRATTSMAHALAAGCREIIPCEEIDQAKVLVTCVPPGTGLLAGERGGLPVEGFDLGNSPEEFTAETCRDKTIIMTTSNGTRAILASLDADQVYVSSFANLSATVDDVVVQCLKKTHHAPIHIVCAGEAGRPAVEDQLCAGALANEFAKKSFELFERIGMDISLNYKGYVQRVLGYDQTDPEHSESTNIAKVVRMWSEVERTIKEGVGTLAGVLRGELGGLRLLSLGRAADIETAAKMDSLDVVGKLGRKPTRISKV